MNLYGFANGDPVNFSDPFGLCPVCIAYAIFEVGSTAYDLYDLATTTGAFIRGRTSRAELGITAAGVGAGLIGFGGGYERAGREVAGRLIRDATENPSNPSNWRAIGSFTEPAVNKKARGGVSIQTIFENEAGDRVVRHTVRDRSGKVIDDHYRPHLQTTRRRSQRAMKAKPRSPDMFVLDALANDIEDLESILRMLNSDTSLGWSTEWGRPFLRAEVVEALSRLVAKDYVQVLVLAGDGKSLEALPATALPPGNYEAAYFGLTEHGRLVHRNWDPSLEAEEPIA